MGVALVKNNAFSTLAATLGSTATSLNVTVGTGVRFPSIAGGSGDFFFMTLIDTSNNIEVVKVTATATDVFTVIRGQDGTTALNFASTSRVELRPTQGLFDDKLSKGGGTMTGHLEAVANASGSQVPRVSEVVKKSGDTMSGPLTLPEIRGVSNEVLIPSGERLRAAVAGGIVAPGMVIQTVYKQVDTVGSVATAGGTVGDVTDMFLAITPKYASSKILVMFDICCETNGHNMVFRLSRNGGAIGNNSTVTLQNWVGWKVSVYDSNDNSTPQQRFMTILDSPNTTSPVTYQLRFIGSSTSAVTLYLNRSVTGADVGQNEYEIGTSSVMLQEIAQ
jgi:hypothetical protein